MTKIFWATLGIVILTVSMNGYAEASPKKALTRVWSAQVCMVNNLYMGSPQIPVKVDGKTYYGCCSNCRQTLLTKPESRMAIDPVSGLTVDKARAFIGKGFGSKVFYFSSLANLRAYRSAE
jgi:YHS domain-containing protein